MIIDLEELEARAVRERTRRIVGGVALVVGAVAFALVFPVLMLGAGLTLGTGAMLPLLVVTLAPLAIVSIAYGMWVVRARAATNEVALDALLGDGAAAGPNQMARRYYAALIVLGIGTIVVANALAFFGDVLWVAALATPVLLVVLDRALLAFVAAGLNDAQRDATRGITRTFVLMLPLMGASLILIQWSRIGWLAAFMLFFLPAAIPALRFRAAVNREDWEAATRLAEWTWPAIRATSRLTAAQGRQDWPAVRQMANDCLRSVFIQNQQPTFLSHRLWADVFEGKPHEAHRTAAVMLHQNPHAASPRALLAFLDCKTGHVSSADFDLLESALEHGGRTYPLQPENAEALVWATLAWAHHLKGNRKDSQDAANEARSVLEAAPLPIRKLAERALEAVS